MPASYQSRGLTTVSHLKRCLIMYSLQKIEVDILRSGYTSPGMGLLGLFAGIAATCYISYATLSLPTDLARKFWDTFVICAGLAIICLFWAIRDWWKAKSMVDTLTKETVEVTTDTKQL